MKRLLRSQVLVLAAVGFLFSATGSAATTFTLSSATPFQTNGSAVSGSGAAETVTLNYSNLLVNINGSITNYPGAYVETYSNNGTFTITGTNGISLTINEASNLVGTFSGNAVNLFSGVTSVNFNAAFLAELGLTSNPTVANITGAAFGVTANGTGAGSVTSAIATMTITAPQGADTIFQVRYASNLSVGDSVVNITNSGAGGAGLQSGTTATITGALCANVYAFTPDEQLVSCCSCPVTPNGLVSLSANNDLANNTLTPAVPTALVIKLLATVPVAGSCTNSAASVTTAQIVPGMLAMGTTIHATPAAGVFGVTETPFSPATLSAGELNRLGQLCNFILANGSGFGVCRSCRLGGLGADRQ